MVTKITQLNLAKIEKEDIEKEEEVFKETLKKLCQKQVYGLLLHNADDLLADGGFFKYLLHHRHRSVLINGGIHEGTHTYDVHKKVAI